MNSCSDCFSSPYLKDIIARNKNIGDCNFCGSTEVSIYQPRELLLFFKNIFDLYSLNEEGSLIENQIEIDFPNKIFSTLLHTNKKLLIEAIAEDEKEYYKSILKEKISLSYHTKPESSEKVNILQVSWEALVAEIKNTNRFHLTNKFDLEKLSRLLLRDERIIDKGKIFYRGRISSKDGFDILNMGHPPLDKTKQGRANPEGISYLYLANDLETTIFETRATLYDYISIGEFRINENIKVVNLRNSENFDPIFLADDDEKLEDFMIHLPFISKLEFELAKPLRRNDNILDYLPTQYLCEFIKSMGFDGVEYRSSLNPRGFNLAIFNPQKIECIKASVHEIHGINYEYKPIE
ncbi:MAG: RES family NAD+ phosphorylase [Bacteroidota bacterium]|nr:RES family NAD+ phosphorylase [Bacteroidota bacterium]